MQWYGWSQLQLQELRQNKKQQRTSRRAPVFIREEEKGDRSCRFQWWFSHVSRNTPPSCTKGSKVWDTRTRCVICMHTKSPSAKHPLPWFTSLCSHAASRPVSRDRLLPNRHSHAASRHISRDRLPLLEQRWEPHWGGLWDDDRPRIESQVSWQEAKAERMQNWFDHSRSTISTSSTSRSGWPIAKPSRASRSSWPTARTSRSSWPTTKTFRSRDWCDQSREERRGRCARRIWLDIRTRHWQHVCSKPKAPQHHEANHGRSREPRVQRHWRGALQYFSVHPNASPTCRCVSAGHLEGLAPQALEIRLTVSGRVSRLVECWIACSSGLQK